MTTLFDLIPAATPPKFTASCGVPERDTHCARPRVGIFTLQYLDPAGVWTSKMWAPTCADHEQQQVARATDLGQSGWLRNQQTRVIVDTTGQSR